MWNIEYDHQCDPQGPEKATKYDFHGICQYVEVEEKEVWTYATQLVYGKKPYKLIPKVLAHSKLLVIEIEAINYFHSINSRLHIDLNIIYKI